MGSEYCTIQSENMASPRCTHILATPSLYLDMICTSQELGVQVTTLRAAAFGGAPCSQELALQIKQALNVRTLIVSNTCSIFLMCLGSVGNVFPPYLLVLSYFVEGHV
jgi:phenylacetate-coenzyme A ligase PaaK-like adenylate-forming protein